MGRGVWQTQELLLAKGHLKRDDCSGQIDCYNRTPIRTLSWHTPFELWNSGQIPDVLHLHIFGCKEYMHVPHNKHCKLDAKAVEVTLVGYERRKRSKGLLQQGYIQYMYLCLGMATDKEMV